MRRVASHRKMNLDGEELQILVCYEEGINKEQVKKENPYSKQHQILIKKGPFYSYLDKRA